SKAFDNIKKGIERVTSEREGATGVRSVVGRQAGVDIVLVQVPPYPEAVAEVVSELYLFGVRRIISISRAYSIGRRMSQRPVVIAKAAIPLDSVSREISGEELPLMPSSKMEYTFRSIAELRFSDFNWVYGYTITVPTIYVRPLIEKIRKIAGKRGVVAVDTVTAALYALQYEYTHLETLSLLVLAGHLDQYASSSIARSLDEHSSIIEYIGRNETILYMVAIEILKRLREA
ncbi:MAG: hypothetical protein F7C34_01635, partial [Desulfurococcales archaeon]|nr:hypothetical protein [Desulfurococcales archaeon]